jgi:hypothetical protein
MRNVRSLRAQRSARRREHSRERHAEGNGF